jgi:hypothetical protein
MKNAYDNMIAAYGKRSQFELYRFKLYRDDEQSPAKRGRKIDLHAGQQRNDNIDAKDGQPVQGSYPA